MESEAPKTKPPEKPSREVLPVIPTPEHAFALFEAEKDPFYLAAFMLQSWLGGLLQRAVAEYAEKKNPKERSLQAGEAWRAFLEDFPGTAGNHFRFLLSALVRFSLADDSPRNSLRVALLPLTTEQRCTGDFFGPKTMQTVKSEQEANEVARRTLIRWCDWLDAAIHLRIHRHWHLAPDCFDPDPEKRQLAALGNAQRHLAALDPRAKTAWLWEFADAADRFKDSPKWAALGQAMASETDRAWTYADVDMLVIALWPMVKRYNWTYRDLLNVIRPGLKRQPSSAAPSTPAANLASDYAYPCAREQDFSTYCANVLGLRKTGKGVTAKNGRPKGYDIAIQLCPGLAPSVATSSCESPSG